jgi:hypothetical protein
VDGLVLEREVVDALGVADEMDGRGHDWGVKEFTVELGWMTAYVQGRVGEDGTVSEMTTVLELLYKSELSQEQTLLSRFINTLFHVYFSHYQPVEVPNLRVRSTLRLHPTSQATTVYPNL